MPSVITQILTFIVILGVFLAAYGATTGLPQITNTVNQITRGFPSLSVGVCSPAVFCVNQIGDFFYSLVLIAGEALFKIGALFFLFYQLVSLFGALNGIPILGPGFVTLFTIILAIYAYSHFRGSHAELG